MPSRAVARRHFGTAAQVDVAGDIAGLADGQPQTAPARAADLDIQSLQEGQAHAAWQARFAARHRLEQRAAVRAVVAQVVVEVGEEGRQVGLAGRPHQPGVRLLPHARHSPRAIRIFWMSLVPS
jgi:hypothetical protein